MPKVNVSGHTKSTPWNKWFTTDVYLHIESKAMTLWKHFQHFVCISNNGHPYIFVGSNMLACQICQCFFVGQWMDWPSPSPPLLRTLKSRCNQSSQYPGLVGLGMWVWRCNLLVEDWLVGLTSAFCLFHLQRVSLVYLLFLIPTKTGKHIKAKGVALIVDDLRTEGMCLKHVASGWYCKRANSLWTNPYEDL